MDIPRLVKEAESGSVLAQTALGICYLYGAEVEVNYHEALRLLSAAADAGAPRAKASLARMYAEGLGVRTDLPTAVRIYEEAAQAGEFLAQVELARIYLKGGQQVPADPTRALKWYRAAASADDRVEDCEELREAKAFVSRAKSKA